MTALEARQNALEKQKNRWSKVSLEVRESIQHSISCGQLSCIVYNLDNMEIYNLRALGYKIRNIVEDNFEISW